MLLRHCQDCEDLASEVRALSGTERDLRAQLAAMTAERDDLRTAVERLKAEVASEARHCAAALVERDEALAFAVRLYRAGVEWSASIGVSAEVDAVLLAAPESVKRAAEDE
jgi:chromosome segregation ATPase